MELEETKQLTLGWIVVLHQSSPPLLLSALHSGVPYLVCTVAH